jgi:oligopeptide transport system ATP-binding protein
MANDEIIHITNLHKYYPIRSGIFGRTAGYVKAVDGVTLKIRKGETIGLVGESGCGKTTLGRTVLRLTDPTGGKIVFDGTDVTKIKGKYLREYRKKVQIVFQDPYSSMDPRQSIASALKETISVNGVARGEQALERVIDLLRLVGLDESHLFRYPHEFSGGQRQRICIARALSTNPEFIVLDEPTSSLDVSVQAQLLKLLKDLQVRLGLTYLFISHNLAVVRHVSDRIGVMYLGKLVELTEKDSLFADPLHPYTRALLSAVPEPDPSVSKEEIILTGDPASSAKPPNGCRFNTRCNYVFKKCYDIEPALLGQKGEHSVACFLYEDKDGAKPKEERGEIQTKEQTDK